MPAEKRPALVEVYRCLHSTMGQLAAIVEAMPECEQGFELNAVLEGGMPEFDHEVKRALADAGLEVEDGTGSLSYDRGYQVMVLMRRDEPTGSPAWAQHPHEFMAEYRKAQLEGESTDAE